MSPRWYFIPLPLLIACGNHTSNSAAVRYRESEALARRGVVRKALASADRGWREWKNQPTAEWHWKFRLLEAELLRDQGSVVQALELLESGGAPPTSALKIRWMASLGQASKDRVLIDQALELASRDGYSALLPEIE